MATIRIQNIYFKQIYIPGGNGRVDRANQF